MFTFIFVLTGILGCILEDDNSSKGFCQKVHKVIAWIGIAGVLVLALLLVVCILFGVASLM